MKPIVSKKSVFFRLALPGVFLLLLLAGGAAGYYLTQINQDVRQQAFIGDIDLYDTVGDIVDSVNQIADDLEQDAQDAGLDTNDYISQVSDCVSAGGSTDACRDAIQSRPDADATELGGALDQYGTDYSSEEIAYCVRFPSAIGCEQISGGTGGCFVAGTQVTMADGSTKNIEDIQVGESVRSYDESTGTIVNKPVLKTISPINTEMVTITFSNGTINTNSTSHPYLVKGKGWSSVDPSASLPKYEVQFAVLEEGDVVYVESEDNLNEVVVTDLETFVSETQTYNLATIADTHTYFANGVLVHNKFSDGSGSLQDEYRNTAECTAAGNNDLVCDVAFGILQDNDVLGDAPIGDVSPTELEVCANQTSGNYNDCLAGIVNNPNLGPATVGQCLLGNCTTDNFNSTTIIPSTSELDEVQGCTAGGNVDYDTCLAGVVNNPDLNGIQVHNCLSTSVGTFEYCAGFNDSTEEVADLSGTSADDFVSQVSACIDAGASTDDCEQAVLNNPNNSGIVVGRCLAGDQTLCDVNSIDLSGTSISVDSTEPEPIETTTDEDPLGLTACLENGGTLATCIDQAKEVSRRLVAEENVGDRTEAEIELQDRQNKIEATERQTAFATINIDSGGSSGNGETENADVIQSRYRVNSQGEAEFLSPDGTWRPVGDSYYDQAYSAYLNDPSLIDPTLIEQIAGVRYGGVPFSELPPDVQDQIIGVQLSGRSHDEIVSFVFNDDPTLENDIQRQAASVIAGGAINIAEEDVGEYVENIEHCVGTFGGSTAGCSLGLGAITIAVASSPIWAPPVFSGAQSGLVTVNHAFEPIIILGRSTLPTVSTSLEAFSNAGLSYSTGLTGAEVLTLQQTTGLTVQASLPYISGSAGTVGTILFGDEVVTYADDFFDAASFGFNSQSAVSTATGNEIDNPIFQDVNYVVDSYGPVRHTFNFLNDIQ